MNPETKTKRNQAAQKFTTGYNPPHMNDRERFETTLRSAAEGLGLAMPDEQVARMWEHFERVRETNRQFNLTRITEPDAAAAKLYADSLAPLAWVHSATVPVRTCLDIGSGAGFPAIPIAIAQPKWRVTALDSTGKKTRFIANCAKEMAITNLTAIQMRAGQDGAKARFDLVLLKAVGDLAKCLTFAANYVPRDGHVIVFKGRNLTHEELDAGQRQAEQFGMQTWDTVEYDIPLAGETLEHSLIVYRRVG